MGLTLALAAALAYGAADFLGGIASKRTPAVVVVVLAQIAGFGVLLVLRTAVPVTFRQADVPLAILGGVFGAIGIATLYAALAIGRMGVVSPVTAVVGAAIPVGVGFARGTAPSLAATAGLGIALVAVACVSASGGLRPFSLREPGLALALASGAAIGGLYVVLAAIAGDGIGALAMTRAFSIAALLAYALVRREPLRPAAGDWPTIAGAGVLDIAANVLYLFATRVELLAIAAVLTSLYPASTVFLARIVLGERLSRLQWTGVALAALAVGLIAA